MNKRTMRIASWTLGLSLAIAGVGLTIGASRNTPVETNAASVVESVYKTALFGSNYNSQGVSSYIDSWSSTNSGFTVNLSNFNNSDNAWSYVRCGRKGKASVGTITTASAIDQSITKVVVKVDSCTTSKVNSQKLYVASDASFAVNVQEIAVDIETGNNIFTVTNPAANMFTS